MDESRPYLQDNGYNIDVFAGVSANLEFILKYKKSGLAKKEVTYDHTTVAGSSVNNALGFCSNGRSVRLLITAGEDHRGLELVEELERMAPDLNVRLLHWRVRTPYTAIGHCIDDGEYSVLPSKPPYDDEKVQRGLHIIQEEIQTNRPRILLASGVRVADVPIVESLFHNGSVVSLRVLNPGADLLESPENLRRLLARTDLLIINREEFQLMQTTLDIPDVHRAHELGPTEIVVTHDEGGAIYSRQGEPPILQPAFVADAIDPTGAGDCFLSHFLSARLDGKDDREALRFAAAAAALQTTLEGGSSVPSPAAVQELLATGELRQEPVGSELEIETWMAN